MSKYAVALLLAAGLVTSTSADGPQLQQSRFEVESIKRNTSIGPSFLSVAGDRFTATNFPLRILIRNAYRLQPPQLIGGPDWLDDRYDILAKSPVPITSDGQREMLRALLAERFRLVVHAEKRESPIYALVLNRADGRLGPRLTRVQVDCAAVRAGRLPAPTPSQPQRPVCDWTGGTGYFLSGGVTMSVFADALSLRVERPVVDRTGLAGEYEFDVVFNPGFVVTNPPPDAPAIDPDAPVLLTALQEQLGLKLEPTTGPADVLVIDSIERPTQN